MAATCWILTSQISTPIRFQHWTCQQLSFMGRPLTVSSMQSQLVQRHLSYRCQLFWHLHHQIHRLMLTLEHDMQGLYQTCMPTDTGFQRIPLSKPAQMKAAATAMLLSLRPPTHTAAHTATAHHNPQDSRVTRSSQCFQQPWPTGRQGCQGMQATMQPSSMRTTSSTAAMA